MVVKLANGLVSAGQFDNYACPIAVNAVFSTKIMVDTLNCGKQLPKKIYVRQASAKNFTFTDTEEDFDFGTATAITFGVWESVATGSSQVISKTLGSGVTAAGGNDVLVSLTDSDTDIETSDSGIS